LRKKRILVAPLNWGLGHATRCIPLIKALEAHDFVPIIASDGIALSLLKKEFPHLQHLELPSYDIHYAQNGKNFKWKLIKQLPKMISAIKNEKKAVAKLAKEHQLDGIISDNRLGVFSKKVPSVFITHQLYVLTGNTSYITTKLHHYFINKFNECWVPDCSGNANLTGKLGHLDNPLKHTKYIGPLSRLHKKALPKKYEVMIILSGPEPQRTLLEEKLIKEFANYNEPTLFIRGVVENEQKTTEKDNITFYNFMNSEQLEVAFNESERVVCRSGYTTVMDLAQLGKKAFFIPTPGQYEQEYLAKKYKHEGIAPSCKQEKFKLSKLDKIDLYRGLQNYSTEIRWKDLFRLF
jgi:uncharacterized protein (TIGR00661 family)